MEVVYTLDLFDDVGDATLLVHDLFDRVEDVLGLENH